VCIYQFPPSYPTRESMPCPAKRTNALAIANCLKRSLSRIGPKTSANFNVSYLASLYCLLSRTIISRSSIRFLLYSINCMTSDMLPAQLSDNDIFIACSNASPHHPQSPRSILMCRVYSVCMFDAASACVRLGTPRHPQWPLTSSSLH